MTKEQRLKLLDLKHAFCKLFHEIRDNRPVAHYMYLYLLGLTRSGILQRLKRLHDQIIELEPEWGKHWT